MTARFTAVAAGCRRVLKPDFCLRYSSTRLNALFLLRRRAQAYSQFRCFVINRCLASSQLQSYSARRGVASSQFLQSANVILMPLFMAVGPVVFRHGKSPGYVLGCSLPMTLRIISRASRDGPAQVPACVTLQDVVASRNRDISTKHCSAHSRGGRFSRRTTPGRATLSISCSSPLSAPGCCRRWRKEHHCRLRDSAVVRRSRGRVRPEIVRCYAHKSNQSARSEPHVSSMAYIAEKITP